MKIVAIVQARVGSTRLPGKVLSDIAGDSMLARVMTRLQRCGTLTEIVIGTTTVSADDRLVALCAERGWLYARGSEIDVLDRYYRIALARQADVVVRITSDCPLIDPTIVDHLVTQFLQSQPRVDFAATDLPRRTFPRGLDAEVIGFDVLKRVWNEDRNPLSREHVTLYIYNHLNLFSVRGVTNDIDYSHLRWTVDTPQDLSLVRRIYEHIGHDRFSWHEVLDLLDRHPQLLEINRDVQQKPVPT